MSGNLSEEFESYRNRLHSEAERQSFDRKIKQLLQERGVDYVRGYVDGLMERIKADDPECRPPQAAPNRR